MPDSIEECRQRVNLIGARYIRARVHLSAKRQPEVEAGLDAGIQDLLVHCNVMQTMEEGLARLRRDLAQRADRFDRYLDRFMREQEDLEQALGLYRYATESSPQERTAAAEAHRLMQRHAAIGLGATAGTVPWRRLLEPYLHAAASAPSAASKSSALPPISARAARVTVGGAGPVKARGAKQAAASRRTRTSPARTRARS